MYAVEELRAQYHNGYTISAALPEEKKILNYDDEKAYEYALNVAREVEATIFAYFKQDLKRYVPKIKILVQFLHHEKNFELRFKILSRRMTAQEICVAKDQVYFPQSTYLQ